MTYKEALGYLNSFYDYEKNPAQKIQFTNLERIKKLAHLFKNPQDSYVSLHITGTKGKGSTAFMLSRILKESGFKVGLYTSPHISDVRERIKINNKKISKEDLTDLVKKVSFAIKTLGSSFNPSFFEVYTLLAFEYFRQKRVDFAVFEVGLGGRFDATNIIKPLACAMTPISYDHMNELGPRLEDITREKAEIIKEGVSLCIASPQKRRVMEIIRNKCRETKVPLCVVGKDIKFTGKKHSSETEKFDINTKAAAYKDLEISLLGAHQIINCATAIGLAEAVISKGYDIPRSAIYGGLEGSTLSSRCEVVKQAPITIIDGAHNRESARALKETLARNFKFKGLILILGLSRDKDIKGVCGELSGIADNIILTKTHSARAAEPQYIQNFLKDKKTVVSRNIKEAYNISKEIAGVDDIIVITGSFYLAGEAKKLFGKGQVSV